MATRRNYLTPQADWTVDDMPDQSGKVFLITGGNTGLGFVTAKILLSRNAKVYITSRNRERGQMALDQLRRVSEMIHLLPLDLSDLHSVRRAAIEFMRHEQYLHVLINNAGVMSPPAALLTRQRYDYQFGVNVLGHFYLTQLLLPVLLTTTRAMPQPDKVRVIHYTCTLPQSCRIDYTTLMDGPVRRRRTPTELYQQSKLGDLLFAMEMADQYRDQGIVSLAVNPGNVYTELTRHTKGVGTIISNMFTQNVSKGVVTPLFAATALRAGGMNGKLLDSRGRVNDVPMALLARSSGETLWDWLVAQTECFEIVHAVECKDSGIEPEELAGKPDCSRDLIVV
ncbi:NAD(P)-binding protein [Lenzites betulinus]|nr:NAD(P)-binding protein [Lenzites betulinus]